MSRPFRLLIVTGAFLIAGMLLLAMMAGMARRRPAPLPILRETSAFTLTNQAGLTLTEAAFRGRPTAVDLIFTRCPGPCRRLTATLRQVAESLPRESRAALVSLTSDPEFDTPPVLAEYASRYGTDPVRWHFVTGDRTTIRRLATEDLMMVLVDKAPEDRDGPDDLFLHSTLIVVLDGKGRVRAAIEGLEPGAAERVVLALGQLEAEEQD